MADRTLVVILCETRSHSRTFEGLKRNVLDVFDADLALCVADNEREDKTNDFYKHARFVWSCPEYSDWGEALEQYLPGIHPRWRECAAVGNQWMGGIATTPRHPGSGGIILFFRIFLRHMLQRDGVVDQYDRYIITRSDFVFEVPHPPPRLLSNEYLWFADGEHYGGIEDRHTICPSRHILQLLSVADLFTEDPDDVIRRMRAKTWNPEMVIKDHVTRTGLISFARMMPYIMYSVREEGGHTSWSKGKYDARRGVYIKYPSELRQANVARVFLGRGPWTNGKIQQILWYENARRMCLSAWKFPSRLARSIAKKLK